MSKLDSSPKRILVTGAAGFIGAALSSRLLQEGHQVLGVDNFSPYYDIALKNARLARLVGHSSFEFVNMDIAEAANFNSMYSEFRPQLTLHMAAQAGVRYSLDQPHAYIDSNIRGFMNVLEAVRHHGTQHLVFASSSSVYGANSAMPYSTHQSTDHPISLYAATKKANEMMAHSYSHLFHIPMTGLRFFTVYGPWGRPDMAVISFTQKILKNETIAVFNHGKHRRDFTFIDDIVEGVLRVLRQPAKSAPNWSGLAPDPATSSAPYRIYNIGNNRPVLLADFISTLEKVIGKPARLELKPIQPGDVHDTFADISDLQRDFDFKPNTSLETGLRKFYEWYESYYV